MTDTRTFVINVTAPATTALAVAANALSVNQWAAFKTGSWPGGTTAFWKIAGAGDGVLDFLHVGHHDSTRGKIQILGTGYGPMGHVIYDIASDTWTSNAISFYNIHAWDHTALDQVNGVLYWGSQGGATLYSTTAAAPTAYTTLSPPWTGFNDTYGMEYWPGVGLVAINRNGQVYNRPDGGSWALVSSGGPALGAHPFLSYNPVLDCMYFGGGQGTSTVFRKLTKVGAAWTITALPASPGVDCVRQKLTCTDRTGHVVLVDHNSGAVHRYIDGGAWAQITTSFPAQLVNTAARSAAVPLRGLADREVVMSFNADADTPSNVYCYLYRYS